MRHQRAGVHLSRTSAHRKALFSNLVAALFTYERIKTTDVKAKATRRIAERTITWARRLGDVLTKTPEGRSPEERTRVVHAVRMARRIVRNRVAVTKLFDEIGPRYLGRPGGYTRIIKIGQRPGDAAPMSYLELMPGEGGGSAAQDAPAEKKAKTSGAKKGAEASAAAPKKSAAAKEGGATKAKAKAPKGDAPEGGAKKSRAKKKSDE